MSRLTSIVLFAVLIVLFAFTNSENPSLLIGRHGFVGLAEPFVTLGLQLER